LFIAHQQRNQEQQGSRLACAVNQVGVFRRKTWLVYQLSFTVASGECWLLTGQNGSGKTTLLRILAGLNIPDVGDVTHYCSNDLNCHSSEASLLYIASPPAKIPELSVIENLRFHALLRWGKHPVPAVIHQALIYWKIDHLATQSLENLSQGQQQRVALALLLLGPAKLWLLDEPTTALDAASVDTFWVICRKHQAKGGSIMMATHQAPSNRMPGLRRIQLGAVCG
jgi:heme exporter protein A